MNEQRINRCPGCGGPTPETGDTCSFACYEWCCAQFAESQKEYMEWMKDLEVQPWYEAEQARIERWVETHGSTAIHEE